MDKIIYLQSNIEIAKTFREAFWENDIEIVFAKTGEEALNILEREKVLLLLLDINIPDMDIYEITDKLREKQPRIGIFTLIDVVDPLTVTKLANVYSMEKIYLAPWDLKQITCDVKEKIQVLAREDIYEIDEKDFLSERQEIEETIEKLKSKLKRQQKSYKKLQGLTTCFTDAFSIVKQDDEEYKNRLDFAVDVYTLLLKNQTTGSFNVEKFKEDIVRDLKEIKGNNAGIEIGEVVSCFLAGQSRVKAQNIRFCIGVLAKFYSRFEKFFRIDINSRYITTKTAEFELIITYPEKIKEKITETKSEYYNYIRDIITDMSEDFRMNVAEKSVTYFMNFEISRD